MAPTDAPKLYQFITVSGLIYRLTFVAECGCCKIEQWLCLPVMHTCNTLYLYIHVYEHVLLSLAKIDVLDFFIAACVVVPDILGRG